MEGTIRQGARITALAFIGPEGAATELTDMPFDMVARIYEDIEDDDIGNMQSALTGTTYSDVGDKFLRKACDKYLQQTDKIEDICENPKNLTQLKCKEQLGMCDKVLYSFDQLIDEGQGVYRIPHGVKVVALDSYDNGYNFNSWKEKEKIQQIIIPDTVTTIGGNSFSHTSLGSIDLPDSVTTIGLGAFYWSGLRSIILPNSVRSIGSQAFSKCFELREITIPNSITRIAEYTFFDCERLATINIPNSVTEIKYGAFALCKRLTSIIIPDSVTNIGEYAFWKCERLATINIPNSVTKIGEGAFYSCWSLEDITLPRHFRNKPEMVQKAFDANVIDKIKYR